MISSAKKYSDKLLSQKDLVLVKEALRILRIKRQKGCQILFCVFPIPALLESCESKMTLEP